MMEFGLSDAAYNARQADGKDFCCPAGHRQYFSPSTISRLEKRLDDLETLYKDQQETLSWYTQTYVPYLEAKIEQLKAERRSARCSVAAYKRVVNDLRQNICHTENAA